MKAHISLLYMYVLSLFCELNCVVMIMEIVGPYIFMGGMP